jgi:hypothetical protein
VTAGAAGGHGGRARAPPFDAAAQPPSGDPWPSSEAPFVCAAIEPARGREELSHNDVCWIVEGVHAVDAH